jgi:cytochrome c oxidase assembly protein subunit 15
MLVAAMVFAMVVVGGITRLTESGLSITRWEPISGAIPPLGADAWQAQFDLYKASPQYAQMGHGMTLADFKFIFFWEYVHRLLGRLIGLAFALPLAWFWWKRAIPAGFGWKLGALLALGALQGAIGWWMVASGLVDRVSVSQYRLATHLTLAALIFTATMVVARGLAPHSEPAADRSTQRLAGVLVLLALVQIYLGGLVAGLDAGLSYNTWPLMDGKLIPGDLLLLEPAWRNFFENPKTVQFVHRCGAYLVWTVALAQMMFALWRAPKTTHARRASLLFLLVTLQAAIGITTLLMQVPIDLGLAHQAMALVVLGFATAHWRGTKGAYPVEEERARA